MLCMKTMYMSQEMKFRAPMFVDTKYKALFEITAHNAEKHSGTVSCRIVDGEGKDCITGEAMLKHFTQF